jgi:hypothetical protein
VQPEGGVVRVAEGVIEAVAEAVGEAVEDRLLPLLAVPVGLGEAEGLEQDSLRMRLELVSATNTAPEEEEQATPLGLL